MKRSKLSALRFFSLLFLLPGLVGLIVSAYFSTYYLETLPRTPVPAESRMIPRNIHGTLVYQTEEEDSRLSLCEYASTGVFLVGLVLGVVYLEKWAATRQLGTEEPQRSRV